MPNTQSCELLIIGSGVGGATLAYELSHAGIDVLMIEEGSFIQDISQRGPTDNFSQVWRNGGLSVALGKSPIAYAEACCVGGGSEINSGIFQYVDNDLLDVWAKKYSIAEFSGRILQAYYETAENMITATCPPTQLDSSILEQAAQRLSWKISHLKVAQKNQIKQTLSQTLIPQALKQGLRLIAQCKAKKLIIKQRRVVAVKAMATDQHGRHHAILIKPNYVFLAAGAIHTPHLLLKSGISKHIGKTLRTHPTIKTLCQFQQPISLKPSPVPNCAITEFMPNIRIGGSVMSPSFIGMSIAEDWQNRKHLLNHMDYCGLYYAMIRPDGIGKIRFLPGFKEPLVSFHLTQNDKQTLLRALDYLQRAMFAAGAVMVYPSVNRHAGWKAPAAFADIEKLAQRLNLMTIHLFSSCPMGENQDHCAVDSFGKLHHYHNVFISDASIIPEAPGTNPQGTIMALALRNAQHFIHRVY